MRFRETKNHAKTALFAWFFWFVVVNQAALAAANWDS